MLNPALEFRHVEIDQQADWNSRQPHISENLRLVDWQKRFDGFDLHDQLTADKQINAIAAIQQNVFVAHPNGISI